MDNKRKKRKIEGDQLQEMEEEILRDAEKLKCQYEKITANLDALNQTNYELQDQALKLMGSVKERFRVPSLTTRAQDELLNLNM